MNSFLRHFLNSTRHCYFIFGGTAIEHSTKAWCAGAGAGSKSSDLSITTVWNSKLLPAITNLDSTRASFQSQNSCKSKTYIANRASKHFNEFHPPALTKTWSNAVFFFNMKISISSTLSSRHVLYFAKKSDSELSDYAKVLWYFSLSV